MRILMISLLIVLMSLPLLLAAQGADRIIGTWLNGEGSSRIQIWKAANGTYSGKIVWLQTPNNEQGQPKVDHKNPNRTLRSRALMNLVILTGLSFDKDNKYEGGRIYDPKSGNTYSCKGELRNNNTLALRGFVGVSLIGRTDTWTRVR